MTIAIDKATNKVCGQVLGELAPSAIEKRPWGWIRLLTASGYCDVDAASVRLERVAD